MALTTVQKTKVTKTYQRHEKDTGSPEYQIALLTEQVRVLTLHLQKNKNDLHSRRGLIRMVNRRRKMLDYLKQKNEKAYSQIIKKLGLKR